MSDSAHADRSRLLPPALAALDAAVRGISDVLDVERVLQLIVDRVRELVNASYAALGIVDREGVITRFITSGITAEQRAAIGELPRGRGLLGLIIRENRSYRIPKIADHPESFGFPPNHPPMTSFLGVPVLVEGTPVGRLYLTDKIGASEFSTNDQALVETFALHAGIAIQNARLHEQVGRLAVFDERDRISRELHDGIIQSIYAVTLSLDDVPDLMAEDSEEARRRVDTAIDALQGVIREIRSFIFGLGPILVESSGLWDGLRALADDLHRNTAIDLNLRGGETPGVPVDVQAELLAIAREALANVSRHSGASRAWVELSSDPDRLTLEIGDDGRGLPSSATSLHGHHGLANMRVRAESLRGTFETRTAPNEGTRIIVSVPLIESRT